MKQASTGMQGQSEGQGELVAGSLRLLELLCRVLWVRLEGAYTHKLDHPAVILQNMDGDHLKELE